MKRVIFTFLVIAAGSIPASAKYSGGTGTSGNPYKIATATDLNDIGNHPEDFKKHFTVVDDINLVCYTGTQFNIIGSSWENAFRGVFDGCNHVISSFSFQTSEYIAVGLFNELHQFGIIKNTRMEDVFINAPNGQFVGALVGSNDGTVSNCGVSGIVLGSCPVGGLAGNNMGTISACHTSVNITGLTDIGGLVGINELGEIINCHATGTVIASDSAGGLVGWNSAGARITACYAKATVEAGSYLGGLTGLNLTGGVISDSFATGDVSGTDCAGGLIGYNGNYTSVLYCYANGSVSADANVGALVGADFEGTYIGCFWDANVNPALSGVGNEDPDPNGVTGETTKNMQSLNTFTLAGWDFVWETINGPNDIWAICEGVTYPKLAWQFILGDSDNDKDVDFADFAPLANKWMQADSNLYCGGTDLTGDGLVNLEDLAALAENWLRVL